MVCRGKIIYIGNSDCVHIIYFSFIHYYYSYFYFQMPSHGFLSFYLPHSVQSILQWVMQKKKLPLVKETIGIVEIPPSVNELTDGLMRTNGWPFFCRMCQEVLSFISIIMKCHNKRHIESKAQISLEKRPRLLFFSGSHRDSGERNYWSVSKDLWKTKKQISMGQKVSTFGWH